MAKPAKSEKSPLPFCLKMWMPNDQKVEVKWLNTLISEVENQRDLPCHPIIQEFEQAVEKNPVLHMQYSQMFTDVTHNFTPTGEPQVRDYHTMFRLVNYIMLKKAPEFNETGLVGFPINAILNWSMATTHGSAAFLSKEANEHWMKVLNKWGDFLKSPASTYVLVSDEEYGWFSRRALASMPRFVEEFVCDPSKEHYGFTSWDDFFTRKLRVGVRPIAEGDDVIANACESHPYELQTDVKMMNEFWIKNQNYSLAHMLAHDPLASEFENGTVYQAFLSALKYHRWHSPVSGTVVKAYKVPGTYYAASLVQGEDDASPNKSQGYICHLAARALIFIEADHPKIGLTCFVAVGMAEVSTCEIRPDLIPTETNKNPRVEKGEEMGMFHFGGSTYCLIFRPGVRLDFDSKVHHLLKHPKEEECIHVNSRLATVVEDIR